MRPVLNPNAALRKAVRKGKCLIWTGSTYSNGYGKLYREARAISGRRRRTTLLAHRESFLAHCGAIPRGYRVIHRSICSGDHRCIEPSHLKAVPEPKKMREWVKRRSDG